MDKRTSTEHRAARGQGTGRRQAVLRGGVLRAGGTAAYRAACGDGRARKQ